MPENKVAEWEDLGGKFAVLVDRSPEKERPAKAVRVRDPGQADSVPPAGELHSGTAQLGAWGADPVGSVLGANYQDYNLYSEWHGYPLEASKHSLYHQTTPPTPCLPDSSQ